MDLCSRINSGEVGAACVWQSPSGWTGRRFHVGTKKEVFDAKTFAIYQALDRRRESGHRYAVFVDLTAAIDRARTDALGPGQHFAIAAMEVCACGITVIYARPPPLLRQRLLARQ